MRDEDGEKEFPSAQDRTMMLIEIHQAISRGAASFLAAEYKICFLFLIVFGAVVFFLVGSAGNCISADDGITRNRTSFSQA